jgi:hypothetical protein
MVVYYAKFDYFAKELLVWPRSNVDSWNATIFKYMSWWRLKSLGIMNFGMKLLFKARI